MIERIEHLGKLIHECPIEGEGRDQTIFPAQGNGIQVSRDRWLIVYATRGFRFTDDDRSIAYQLRDGSPCGPVIREDMLSQSVDDWDPFGEGMVCTRQHGHPVAFGVPRGAHIGGAPAPNANIFVVKWRVIAVDNDRRDGVSHARRGEGSIGRRTQAVEWLQLRLNDAEDDIEIIQPRRVLRQKGYEEGEAFCERPVAWMNQTFVQAVAFNGERSEWADVNHFDDSRIAPLRYRFNADTGLYEWVETGQLMGGPECPVSEASLLRFGDGWVISARRPGEGSPAWARTEDLFGGVSPLLSPETPVTNAPLSAYMCPDGIVRLFSGDPKVSPYNNGRDPLYCWDVDPDQGFSVSNRRIVFDCTASDLPIRRESGTRVDMCKLLPHAGGCEQHILHRVRPKSTLQRAKTGVIVNEAEMDCSGIYQARVVYSDDHAGEWGFG